MATPCDTAAAACRELVADVAPLNAVVSTSESPPEPTAAMLAMLTPTPAAYASPQPLAEAVARLQQIDALQSGMRGRASWQNAPCDLGCERAAWAACRETAGSGRIACRHVSQREQRRETTELFSCRLRMIGTSVSPLCCLHHLILTRCKDDRNSNGAAALIAAARL